MGKGAKSQKSSTHTVLKQPKKPTQNAQKKAGSKKKKQSAKKSNKISGKISSVSNLQFVLGRGDLVFSCFVLENKFIQLFVSIICAVLGALMVILNMHIEQRIWRVPNEDTYNKPRYSLANPDPNYNPDKFDKLTNTFRRSVYTGDLMNDNLGNTTTTVLSTVNFSTKTSTL